MKNRKNQNLESLRENLLEPEELYLMTYMQSFNRDIEKKWASEDISVFSTDFKEE